MGTTTNEKRKKEGPKGTKDENSKLKTNLLKKSVKENNSYLDDRCIRESKGSRLLRD